MPRYLPVAHQKRQRRMSVFVLNALFVMKVGRSNIDAMGTGTGH